MGMMDGFGLAAVPRAVKAAASVWAEPADAAERARDETVLAALRLRQGANSVEVAQALGVSPEWVRKATNDVVAHDYATADRSTGPRRGRELDVAYQFKKARK